jgi:hypothetical protein
MKMMKLSIWSWNCVKVVSFSTESSLGVITLSELQLE